MQLYRVLITVVVAIAKWILRSIRIRSRYGDAALFLHNALILSLRLVICIFIIICDFVKVAFDKIGSMTTNTISKQRKKQEPAVMKELDQRFRRLNSLPDDDS